MTTHKPGTIFLVKPGTAQIAGRDFEVEPTHPLYDPRANYEVDPAFARNLKATWLKEKARSPKTATCNVEPIQVRYESDDSGKDTDEMTVVNGRQRELAARWLQANDKECDGIMLAAMVNDSANVDDDAAMRMVIVGNVRRDDDADTKALKTFRYLEYIAGAGKAEGAKVEIKESHIREAATDFGVSDETIRNRKLYCEKVAPAVRLMVAEGKIGLVQALVIARAPTEEEQIKLAEQAAASGATVVETVRLVEPREPRQPGTPSPSGDDGAGGAGLTLAEIRKMVALHDENPKTSKFEESTLAVFRAVTGTAPFGKVKGLKEMWTRVKNGEKPGEAQRIEAEHMAEKAKEAANKAKEAAKAAKDAAKGKKG